MSSNKNSDNKNSDNNQDNSKEEFINNNNTKRKRHRETIHQTATELKPRVYLKQRDSNDDDDFNREK